MPDKFGVLPAIPCTATGHIHRDNVPTTTPKDYYRRAFAIPLLDALISELGFWFNKFSICAMKLLYEALLVLCSSTFDNRLHNVRYLYKERFPNHEVIDQELRLWKARYDVLPFQHP